jgi:uncharacterized protein (TIGR03118 family)
MTVSRFWGNRVGFGLAAMLAPVLLSSSMSPADAQMVFAQTNLVSDIPTLGTPGFANHFDPNLKNPWGMSFTPTSPFWSSDQVTGNATLYNASGTPQALVVAIPGGNPTGQVFNPLTAAGNFALPTGGPGGGINSLFIFASLNGTISAWNGSAGTAAQTVATTAASAYTGLALGSPASGNFLYAANAAQNRIDVFNNTFTPTSLTGNFTDPNLRSGLAPYGVRNIILPGQTQGTLFVTYASPNPAVDLGGEVAAFDLNGNFLHDISSNPTGGILSDPWGLTLAPAGFGPFSGDLLVGNKGDGHISAFDPVSGAFEGQLDGPNGTPLANPGLWALNFRAPNSGFDPNTLFFTAGINGEKDGLFGSITVVPEPGAVALLSGLLVSGSLFAVRRLRPRRSK